MRTPPNDRDRRRRAQEAVVDAGAVGDGAGRNAGRADAGRIAELAECRVLRVEQVLDVGEQLEILA